MNRISIGLVVFSLLAAGCQKEDPAPEEKGSFKDAAASGSAATPPKDPSASGGPPMAGGGGNSGSVAPIGGVGAGPMTPVTGSENLQGGGSGVGQVMKERAKGVAGQSPSSINQMGNDDN